MNSDVINLCDEKMTKTINVLKKELSSMKAGRANPMMLDRIEVDYYGTMTKVSKIANVSAPEPRVLLIQPWDKNSIKAIEKAILKSDLGINPSNDGMVIRLVVPELTEETRKSLVKNVKKSGEDAKVAIRSIRKECNNKIKALKSSEDISEDEIKRLEENIQKKTDSYIRQVDKTVDTKEKDILSV